MEIIKIKDVISELELLAPGNYQESYDNSGLLTGDASWNVNGVLITLDCIEAVVDEAIALNCNLIVAHHPIIFKGLKRLTGKNYVERTIIKAIKNDIAIYAIHTNLDNVYAGVNKKIAEQIGLKKLRILYPKTDTSTKLVTFIPTKNKDEVVAALHAAGAGVVGDYKDCSFQMEGTGVFTPFGGAQPHIGSLNQSERVDEVRVEMIFSNHLQSKVMSALQKSHPYEEIAYYLTPVLNRNDAVGSGMIGELDKPMEPIAFLERLKKYMKTSCVRYSPALEKPIQKVALCGGAGSFLLPKAIAEGADAYVSADFKYHEFFDADGQIMIADIGHYESEQFTKDLLNEYLREKFTTFAINFSKKVTNPISYL